MLQIFFFDRMDLYRHKRRGSLAFIGLSRHKLGFFTSLALGYITHIVGEKILLRQQNISMKNGLV